VPISDLREKGVPDHILLWMLYQGHVEHLLQQPPTNGDGHPPSPVASLRLTEGSAFSLTECGEEFGDCFLSRVLTPGGEEDVEAAWEALLLGLFTPSYDKGDRVFSWGQHVLKCFRQKAENQELILCAAEELDWVDWFDDPLPRPSGMNHKVRLHDTIKDLNRHQLSYLIHFKGDGTGTRVGWEYH